MQEILGTRPHETTKEPELPFPYVHGAENTSKSQARHHSTEDDSQLITVKSTQSIQDYFKAKFAGKDLWSPSHRLLPFNSLFNPTLCARCDTAVFDLSICLFEPHLPLICFIFILFICVVLWCLFHLGCQRRWPSRPVASKSPAAPVSPKTFRRIMPSA